MLCVCGKFVTYFWDIIRLSCYECSLPFLKLACSLEFPYAHGAYSLWLFNDTDMAFTLSPDLLWLMRVKIFVVLNTEMQFRRFSREKIVKFKILVKKNIFLGNFWIES